jgi:predicted dehydrogenase
MVTGKNQRTRIAFVGAGQLANSVHYPALASFRDVEIVAACDLDQTRLASTAHKYSIKKTYSDFRLMIGESEPDGVYVIGPPHQMYDVWIWCLQEGLNLFVEKPLGLNWHQAQMLCELAEAKGVITQVGHQRRSSPLLNEMHRRCLDKGPITHAVCEFYKYDIQPKYSFIDHLHDDCSHSVDTVRWMCGGEVVEIDSQCRRIGTPDINWVMAMLHFDNNSTGLVVNSWSSGRRVFRVEMHAPGIYVDAEVEANAFLYSDGDYQGVQFDAREIAGSDELFIFGGFQKKSREFIDSIKNGRETTSSPFRDCVKTMEIVEKILAMAVLRGE